MKIDKKKAKKAALQTAKALQTIAKADVKAKNDSYDGKPNANTLAQAIKTQAAEDRYLAAMNGFGSDKLDELAGKMANRSFRYDPSSDALYQKYKQIYTAEGKRAMEDALGRNASLTGGYTSSYALGQGNAQYGGYLSKLGDVLPGLYDKAYTRYKDEGAQLKNQYDRENSRLKDETARRKDAYNVNLKAYNSSVASDNKKAQRIEKQAEKAAKEKKAAETEQEKKREAAQKQQENALKAEKTQARNNALLVLKTGEMPDKELLDAAGISVSDAKKVAAYYRALLNKRLYG